MDTWRLVYSCLTFRAKHNVNMFGCIESLRATALYSAVLRGSLFGVCVCRCNELRL